MRFVPCTYDQHASAMLGIFNDAIITSTALYDYKPRLPESMVGWFKTKELGRYPVIGAVSDGGELLGFASYGPFRAWPAYKYSIEHSVYVQKDHRGKGIGPALVRELITGARAQQYHCMIGGIDIANTGSIAMHEKLGFKHAGTIKHAGFKFGRWLDLGFWQLLLETPVNPNDG
jgi:L-amino acid N-acyltransferase